MKKYLMILLIFLAGCCTPQIKYIETKVEVPVPCVTNVPEKPLELVKEVKLTDGSFTKVKAVLAELDLRKAYELKMETIMEGCR